MTDFVNNGASQIYGGVTKANATTPTGADTEWKAGDANDIRQALLDLRDVTQEAINVKTDYGAYNDGTNGVSNQTNIQAAVTAAAAASKPVYFPKGTYLITGTITLPSNTYLFGDGMYETVLKQGASNVADEGILCAKGPGTGTPLTNIVVRDLCLDGNATGLGAYSAAAENQCACAFSDIKNVLIERVKFQDWRGDGTYLYADDSSWCTNLIINKCIYDGNLDNRDCIGIIGGDGIWILNNLFMGYGQGTTDGGYGSAIDVEPNPGAGNQPYLRNINFVGNTFTKSRGEGQEINIYIPDETYPVQPTEIRIIGNSIRSSGSYRCVGIAFRHGGTVTDSRIHNLIIRDNRLDDVVNGFTIQGVNGCLIEGNWITGSTDSIFFGGYASQWHYKHVRVINNRFERLSTAGGDCIIILDGSHITFDGNEFIDCGNTSGASGTVFVFYGEVAYPVTTSYVTITRNKILSPNSKTTAAIYVDGYHTLTSWSNKFWDNDIAAGGATMQFTYGYTAAPTVGQGYHFKGEVQDNMNPSAGQPTGWVCTVAGDPGTWVAKANL